MVNIQLQPNIILVSSAVIYYDFLNSSILLKAVNNTKERDLLLDEACALSSMLISRLIFISKL